MPIEEVPDTTCDAFVSVRATSTKGEKVEMRRFMSWYLRMERFDKQWTVIRELAKFLCEQAGQMVDDGNADLAIWRGCACEPARTLWGAGPTGEQGKEP